MKQHKPKQELIFHSDQGRQYTSKLLVEFCEKHNVKQSMIRKETTYDNAVMELFFGKFKTEKINHYILRNYDMARDISLDYIHLYYNLKRPQASLNGVTPLEKRFLAA